MAHSSNSSTRRSLRLLTAERKTNDSYVDEEEDEEELSSAQPTTRQAKSKALEAISISTNKRRSEPEIEPFDVQNEQSTEKDDEIDPTTSTSRKRSHSKQASSSSSHHSIRHVSNSLRRRKRNKKSTNRTEKSSPKTFKRPRQSSSDDELDTDLSTQLKPKRNSAPILPANRTRSKSNLRKRSNSNSDSEQQQRRELNSVTSDPTTSNTRRSRANNHRRFATKTSLDFHLPTGQSSSSLPVTTNTQPGIVDGRPCDSTAANHPLHLFHSSPFYHHPQTSSSSPPPSSSSATPTQPYTGLLHRHPKHSLAMSTESDTDPDTPRDAFADPAFARAAAAAAAAAAGSPTSAALFHTLSGRVQHLMSRVGGSSSLNAMNGRLQQYMQGLQSSDPDVRLTTLNELCSLLVMSNEETLPGFQFRLLYPLLRDCLADENEAHTEISLTACRALTYLMEALPRSAGQIVEATPIFLSKLRSITSIDIAEQALTALEMISKRNGKQILLADGISACLEYLDFFSLTSQNKSLSIVANCCLHILTRNDFNYIRTHLDNLTNRLRSDEKKTLEHICSIFSRLVDNFHRDPQILREIASTQLLKTLQTMLVVQPTLLNSLTFISIIHMLYIFSAFCPLLAVTLLKMNISETIICLLTGSSNSNELISRTPQELYEIVSLIGEMLPRLPIDEPLFQIDHYLRRQMLSNRTSESNILWHWQDDQGQLRPYSYQDSRTIEHAWQQHEEEIQLNISNRHYLIDLQQLQQINEETNQARFIKRITTPELNTDSSPPPPPTPVSNDESNRQTTTTNVSSDVRIEMLKDNLELYQSFILSLFTILYEVYNSSAGPAVKHRCLQSLLRMIYYSPSDLLEQVLKQQSISSHIASMLASTDYKIVINALQMSEILMKKLPSIFSIYFYREGVVHQIEILINFGLTSSSSTTSTIHSTKSEVDLSTTTQRESCPTTTRIETRSQRAKLPKTSSQSVFEEFASRSSAGRGRSGGSRTSVTFRPTSSSSTSSSSFDPSNYYSRSLQPVATSSSTQQSQMILSSQDKAKLKEWIQTQAKTFRQTYFSNNSNVALEIIHRLAQAVEHLHVSKDANENSQALRDIGNIIAQGNVSPFEMVHSGLITKLYQYLTDDISIPHNRHERLKQFLNIFIQIPIDNSIQFREFIFELQQNKSSSSIFTDLINKLHGCINQLEQFPIRVNDIAGRPAHSSALRLITTHQLKCNLIRHPQCKTLKQWNSGPVKIDPLALVSAIEKYLLLRGIATIDDSSNTLGRGGEEEDDDDDEESEVSNESDSEDVLNALTRSSNMRLEFLINEHVIPHNMTIYQAVRLYSQTTQRTDNESETDNDESIFSSAGIWTRVHTLHYRQTTTTTTTNGPQIIDNSSNRDRRTKKTIKTSKRSSIPSIVDELWINGQCSQSKSLLINSLNESISSTFTINDLSLNAIELLRILNSLNLYWYDLYIQTNTIFVQSNSSLNLTNKIDFYSTKLTAKVNRQLQDPVVIMMGQIPSWITEICYSCLFLFPFETRQMLFYPCAFDRERAMQRLLDSSDMLTQQNNNDINDRQSIIPRIERKKVQLSRKTILIEMEKILDNWNSKHFLEVQYEDEVGFGLGPTLEAYSLISKELQKNGLELWRTDLIFDSTKDIPMPEYVDIRNGLYPAPIGRNAKASTVTKLRQKFKFLGKFMAKALMDSRMIDIPFSIVFYKWILGQEESLNLEDLIHIDKNLYEQFKKLQTIVNYRTEQIIDKEKLLFDGCQIEDLSLVFTLPGYSHIELKKGGKDCSVTLDNLEQYIQLVIHWTLVEGVRRQFESFRHGFNSIFGIHHLKCFYPDELHQVFCGSTSNETWDVKILVESTRCDHGYNQNSRAVKWLFELMNEFDIDEQRAFLQFVTGSPRLPVGGFRMLHPPLTIVRKTAETNHDTSNPDSSLPSVMTCVNYLKLPDYSTKEIMKSKLNTAIRDGQNAFLLS